MPPVALNVPTAGAGLALCRGAGVAPALTGAGMPPEHPRTATTASKPASGRRADRIDQLPKVKA
jgi:hypothetical protein